MTADEAADCVNCLGELDYPASRDDLIRIARSDGASPVALDALAGLPNRNFDGRHAIRMALLTPGSA